MPFISNTKEQIKQMLETIGVSSTRDLFSDIPSDIAFPELDLPAGLSEQEVYDVLARLELKNAHLLVPFIGGGFYDHYVPAAIDTLAGRSEFYTAYTPYQPEASQGTLQSIYEFQTGICRLTGMDGANASVYDGGTALFEAAMMAIRSTKRGSILIDSGVSPIYRNMMYCYTKNLSIHFTETSVVHGQTNREEIISKINDDTAAVILQNPNFFGAVDDFSDICEAAHEKGCLVIVSTYPVSLGVLKSPGEMGADIATGEGQSLGIPLSFGGPYLGYMAASKKYVRQLPGRIVGRTVDTEGKEAFVMTMQAREQHIRREKAKSNICTNQALCALRASIYLSILGKDGLTELAALCTQKTEYLKHRLDGIEGISVKKSAPVFNEFTIDLGRNAGDICAKMISKGFAGGFPLGRYYEGMDNYLLVAVTEKRTEEQIGMFAEALEASL